MSTQSPSMLLTGNQAVAWGARLARPKVVPVYPITPQTPVLEQLTEFAAEGTFDAEIITPESEHSVMSACIPASLVGTAGVYRYRVAGLAVDARTAALRQRRARTDCDGQRQPHRGLALGVLAGPD